MNETEQPARPMEQRRRPAEMQRVLLLGLILTAFATRLHHLDHQSLWRDEVDAIYFALRELPDTLAMFVQAGQNGALYFLSLRPWFRVVGASEFALRFPSAWFAVLSVPLLWQVARLLAPTVHNRRIPTAGMEPADGAQTQGESFWAWTIGSVPLVSVLFLIANPYLLWYGQEGKMYAQITALTLLATLLWLRGIGRGGWRPWLGYLLTVSLAIYSHLLMIVIIPLHLLWFGLAWPQSKSHWRGYLAALAGLTLPYLPMLVWQWDLLLDTEKRTGFNFIPLPTMLETLVLDYARGFQPPDDMLWLAPLFFLGLAGLLLGFLEIRPGPADPLPHLRPWRRHLLIATWIGVPILAVYLMSVRQPIFTPRYLIWIAPAALLLLALGIQLIWRNTGVLAKPLSLLLLLYVIGLWSVIGYRQQSEIVKYDLRGAVTYIASQRDPADLLILQIPHMEYAYRYYSSDLGRDPLAGSDRRLGRWAGGLWTNNGWTDEQARGDVDRQMRSLTQDVDAVWLLRSEAEMWDQRQFMDAWLSQNAELVDGADFHGAQVRYYRLR